MTHLSASTEDNCGLRTCAFGIFDHVLRINRSPPMIVRELHLSFAEMSFIRRALKLGRRILTLPASIESIERHLGTNAKDLDMVRDKILEEVARIEVSVVLAAGMRSYTFGQAMTLAEEGDRRLLGDKIIVINYMPFLTLDEMEHLGGERFTSTFEFQINILLLYCGFGMANELLRMIWPALAKDIPSGDPRSLWMYNGNWSLDLVLLGGTVEVFGSRIENSRIKKCEITSPQLRSKLVKLKFLRFTFPCVECVGLLRTRAFGTWPNVVRSPSNMFSRLRLADTWIASAIRALDEDESRAVPPPSFVAVSVHDEVEDVRLAGRTPLGIVQHPCRTPLNSQFRRLFEESLDADPLWI